MRRIVALDEQGVGVESTAAFAVCGACLLAVLMTGCTCAGNFCNDEVLWASNRPIVGTPATSAQFETFNVFRMDIESRDTLQLTDDQWPVVNQHPVFTSSGEQIVWARGEYGMGSLWLMNVDGSAKTRITSPSSHEHDGHPWAGADGHVYFVRRKHGGAASDPHRIWRLNLDSRDTEEILGDSEWDRFHPCLHRDQTRLVYTARRPGDQHATQIRVFDLSTRRDTEWLAPGWPVSAATLSPNGRRVVVAEDENRNGRYRIRLREFPSGRLLRELTSDSVDNTIPYFRYPRGDSVDWIRWGLGSRPRSLARVGIDGRNHELLTNDAYEDTKIVGELEVTGGSVPSTPSRKSSGVRAHPKDSSNR